MKYKKYIFIKKESQEKCTKLINILDRHQKPFSISSNRIVKVIDYMRNYGLLATKRAVSGTTWDKFLKLISMSESELLDIFVLSREHKLDKLGEGSMKRDNQAPTSYEDVHPITWNSFTVDYNSIRIKKNLKLTRENKMSKIDNIINTNTEAAKVAAQITAGKTINKVVVDKLKSSLPLMVRGYADTVLAPVLVANLVSFLVQNFAATNKKANWAADSMMVAAMSDFTTSFNVEKLIAEVLDSVNVSIPETSDT